MEVTPINADQIFRLALFQASEISQAGTVGSFVITTELMSWVNQANRHIEAALRKLQKDYFVKRMNSASDTTAQRIMGIDYTPSTSLQIAASTIRYTLPPDYLSVKSIRCVTSGYEATRFFPVDLATSDMKRLFRWSTNNTASPGDDMYFAIEAERTMVLLPAINAALDIEFSYVARTKPLARYATGTIAVTTATAAVTGTTTVWDTLTPFDQNYVDIMWGPTSGVSTLPTVDPTWDYDSVNLSRILSIDTDTTLTLASNKTGTLAAGTGYVISSVPVIPHEYHYLLADYVTWRILSKMGSSKAKATGEIFTSGMDNLVDTSGIRQQMDIETVEAYTPW